MNGFIELRYAKRFGLCTIINANIDHNKIAT